MTATRRHFLTSTVAALAAPVFVRGARADGPLRHNVDIAKFRFDPIVLEVRPGDIIVWRNHDIAPHTATALDGSWDTGTLTSGQSYELTVGPDMDTEYFCRFHPAMKAKLAIASRR